MCFGKVAHILGPIYLSECLPKITVLNLGKIIIIINISTPVNVKPGSYTSGFSLTILAKSICSCRRRNVICFPLTSLDRSPCYKKTCQGKTDLSSAKRARVNGLTVKETCQVPAGICEKSQVSQTLHFVVYHTRRLSEMTLAQDKATSMLNFGSPPKP